jgi:hypothetical protein
MQSVNTNTDGRANYAAPALERLGSLEEVTLGNAGGNKLDASFPVGTPKSSLTFS